MYSKILFLFLLIPMGLFSQEEKASDTLVVKMTAATSNRVVLYGAKGAQQNYIGFADSETGEFKIAIPKSQKTGMYRLLFDQKSMSYLDFLYSGKGFEIQMDLIKPDAIPVFIGSDINIRYFANMDFIGHNQKKIDSLQVLFFQAQEQETLERLKNEYVEQKELFNAYVTNFDQTEKSQIVKDLIKAHIRIQPEEPIKDPEKYLPFVKEHYFDYLDFNNQNLIHSPILIDKLIDYVFYLTVSRDPEMQNKLYKEAVSVILSKIEKQELKVGFIETLIKSFAKDDNIVLIDYLFDDFYNKLDFKYQNSEFRNTILQELKTAVGRMAGEITWTEDDKIIKLSELKDHDLYIIVFWSTTCPHCLKEMPKFHEFIKENKKVKVISVGIETEESKGAWKSETYYYPEFTHILGLGKWENPIALAYNVLATPNYFILNADKRIIAKPYDLGEMKIFFKGLEQQEDTKNHE